MENSQQILTLPSTIVYATDLNVIFVTFSCLHGYNFVWPHNIYQFTIGGCCSARAPWYHKHILGKYANALGLTFYENCLSESAITRYSSTNVKVFRTPTDDILRVIYSHLAEACSTCLPQRRVSVRYIPRISRKYVTLWRVWWESNTQFRVLVSTTKATLSP